MELWEILVPAEGPDGWEIPLGHHREWDEFVERQAGGLTIYRSAKGVWSTPAGVVREDMIPVRVACSDDVMTRIAQFTLEHYDQQSVFFYRVSDDARLLRRGS